MIPRFFRCGDPTGRCPLAVSREVIKDTPAFICPCQNEQCSLHREAVSWVTVYQKPLMVLGALLLIALVGLLLGGSDPATKALAELRGRLAPLDSETRQLEVRSQAAGTSPQTVTDTAPLEAGAAELAQQATVALESKDPLQVAGLRQQLTTRIATVRGALELLDLPKQGSGVIAADAKSLVAKLTRLEEEAETVFEPILSSSPQSATSYDEFLSELSDSRNRARKLASPGAAAEASPESAAARETLTRVLAQLQAVQETLGQFAPADHVPFQPSEADLVVAASGDLAGDLVVPLVAAWSGGTARPHADGSFYLTGTTGQRILVRRAPERRGFQWLADGECSVFFAERPPSDAELGVFGSSFRENRSVAEVVALDALTLLVHPENPASTVTIGLPLPFPLAAGPEKSALREKAASFQFPLTGAGEGSGEQAALADRNLLSLGFYHEEGANLRAKRLAVQAEEKTLALKPSPFTIATEDYLYTFRIVAWTASKTAEQALQLVKFTTSDEGQKIVAQQGFVDLRLTGSQEDVPPPILAALGSAVGSASVSSAVRLSTNFRFEVGKSLLDLKAQADLERLPRYVFEKYPSHMVVILGFTDSDGGPEINIPLSRDRAEVVSTELRRSKIDARSAGLGAEFPVDTNTTDPGKAKNRRAEVWVVRP